MEVCIERTGAQDHAGAFEGLKTSLHNPIPVPPHNRFPLELFVSLPGQDTDTDIHEDFFHSRDHP